MVVSRFRSRGRRPRWFVPVVLAGTLALAAACAPTPEPVPPTPVPGPDLTVAVTGNERAIIGTQQTYLAKVSSVGTVDTTGAIAVTVVVPPGQTVASVSGTGWTCSNTAAQATCTVTTTVAVGQSLPDVSVVANVAGDPYLANLYAAVSSPGDVNSANDTSHGPITVSPAFGQDQLFIQLAGVYRLRVGGNITSGDVSITSDLLGPQRLVANAQIGTAQVSMDLQRQFATLFTGPVTITDPSLQGGTPLTVSWRGNLNGFGNTPTRNLTGSQQNLVIPDLDVSGITSALSGGITFSMGITAGDYQPTPPPIVTQPPLTYANVTGAALSPHLTLPDRVVEGAAFTLGVEITPVAGATIGPVAADIDLPSGLSFAGTVAGTTCTDVPAVPGRQRCVLDSSLTTPLSPNPLASIVTAVLPVSLPTIGIRVVPNVSFTPLTVAATVDAGNMLPTPTTTTFDARPPGPDVGLTLTGAEQTSNLFFSEGTGLSANQYNLAVDNVGTATSASPTVTLNLPTGVSYRGFTTSGLTAATRFTCSAAAQVVTCTRPNGIGVTGLLTPAPTFAVQVDVAPGAGPKVTATGSVSNPTDVDPSSPAKSASATTRVAAAGAQRFRFSLTNGAFTGTDQPVLEGGYAFTTAPNGRLDGIQGCGTSMNFVPAVLAVPVVGPTLVPALYVDNTLCVHITRVLGTNQFVGTVRTDFTAPPIFLPPPVPALLPPVIPPRTVSVGAASIGSPTLQLDGSIADTATGADPELVLNGGATYQINWQIGPAPGVTCVDVSTCP